MIRNAKFNLQEIMLPLNFFHYCYKKILPHEAIAYILVMAVFVALIFSLCRGRRVFLNSAPGIFYILLSCLPLLANKMPGFLNLHLNAIIIFAGICLLGHLSLRHLEEVKVKRSSKDSEEDSYGISLQQENLHKRKFTCDIFCIYLGAILLITALFLFTNLSGFCGTLLTWETEVSRPFGEIFLSGQSIGEFIRQRFIWTDGLLSKGYQSLLYGAPTYTFFHLFGFYPWTLRIMSVFLTLGSIVLIYLIGRRFFGPLKGTVMAFLCALNPMVIYYGRYGTSAAANLFSVLLAIFCTWLFLEHKKKAWWLGLVCGVSLFLATLNYGSGRIVVLILLGLIFVVIFLEWRRISCRIGNYKNGNWQGIFAFLNKNIKVAKLSWQRVVGVILLLLFCFGVVHYQKKHDSCERFYNAAGEHFFSFLKSPGYLYEYLHRNVDPEKITRYDQLELLCRVLEKTMPEYIHFFSPRIIRHEPGEGIVNEDPPQHLILYYAPMLPFLIWGFFYSLLRIKYWKHAFLFSWVIIASVPLLLTTRVDSHRIFLFVIPLIMWTAFGICEAIFIMKRVKVFKSFGHFLAISFTFIVLCNNVHLLFLDKIPKWEGRDFIADEIRQIVGPIVLASATTHQDASWYNLILLERARKNPVNKGRLLEENLLEVLRNPEVIPSDYEINRLEKIFENNMMLFFPVSAFSSIIEKLQCRGYQVIRRPAENPFYLIIEKGAPASTSVPQVIPKLKEGIERDNQERKVFLSDLTPIDTLSGFALPRFDRTWDGLPIRLNGVVYSRGIGMHAWCQSTYSVPEGAQFFRSIIGISDGIKSCKKTAVTFELLDQEGRVLYGSGLVDHKTLAKSIQIDVSNVEKLTLKVTEGGNGRDCDHANWAMAAFIMNFKK